MVKKRFLYIIFFLSCVIKLYSQKKEIKYYRHQFPGKEVPANKANYCYTSTENADGSVTTEIIELKTNKVLSSKTYKNNEPYGIWKTKIADNEKILNYTFDLNYNLPKCNDSLTKNINDFLKDDELIGYKAPIIATGETSLFNYIAKKTEYPEKAIMEEIKGTVYISFSISDKGLVEDVIVKQGVHVLLDKEACRVIRELQFSRPPLLNNNAFRFTCLVIPIKFSLV